MSRRMFKWLAKIEVFSSNRWTKFAIATLLIVSQSSQATDLIYCGASRVIVIDPTAPLKPEWTWHAIDSPSIPEKSRPWFRSTDECKPYAGGLLLITSSSSGVTLIERETKRCLFLAQSRNAHSACLLPGNQIAVAASFGDDEMQFYKSTDKRRPAVPIQTIPLYGAHGCVWDAKRKCLWALGQSELLRLTVGTDGKWTVRKRWDLPTPGGHDLWPRDDTNLFATSSTQVLLFDRDQETFNVHKSIGDQKKVKSVDRHQASGIVVFHKGTASTWWSDTIRFIGRQSIRIPKSRLYKLRWDVPLELPSKK